MTIMKKIITSLFAFCLLLGFTACTKEEKYIPAEVPTNAQVYFSYTAPSTVSLSPDFNVTSFNVALYRIDKAGALTVNLSVENANPDIFTIPTSVSFSAGSEVANITISYDPEVLGYDSYKPISLAVSDLSLSSPYGVTSYAFSAGIPAPWKTIGKAKISFTAYIVIDNAEVEMQQHEIFPNRYRLVNPFVSADQYYSNMPLNGKSSTYLEFQVLSAGSTFTTWNLQSGTFTYTTTEDGLVVFEPSNIGIGYNDPGTEVLIVHPAGITNTAIENLWLHNIVTRWTPDGQPAVVQLAPRIVVPDLGYGGWNESQKDGICTIIFPGVVLIDYDYSISLDYLGHYIGLDDVDNAIVQFKVGDDVANYKYTIVEGALTASAAEGIAVEIINGTIAHDEDSASAYKVFPLEAGKYTVVAVSFDADGEDQDFDFVSFEFIPAGMENPWISLGFCDYTDGVLAPMYSAPSVTYEVEIFEHQDKPGLFRLKNAYGADYPYNDPGDYVERDVYIEINAIDPDGVYIDYQSMGCDWGDGAMYIYSLAASYLDDGDTLEEAKEDGVCGTYKDDIITFPVKALLFADDDGMYYTNTRGDWKVDMTSLNKPVTANASSMASGFTRSFAAEKAPVHLKANMPVKVDGQNIPASAVVGKFLTAKPLAH